MAVSDEVRAFIREGLREGVSRDRLSTALREAGWGEAEVRTALACYADVVFPVPVPRPRPSLSARDAFLYLLLFTALHLSAFNLGGLLFSLITLALPDPDLDPSPAVLRDGMRWSISLIVVATPLFLALTRLLAREIRDDPAKRASAVRRWLTYLTLFVAAGALIGDVATLVYVLLGGELTVRFLLKVLVVAVLAGSGFWYYLSDLRTDERAASA